MLTLCLPFPPSVNHYWKASGKRRYIGEAGVAFRAAVAVEVAKRKARGWRRIKGGVAMYVQLVPPDKRRRDVDNYNKAILDALMHAGCYDDDSQVEVLVVEKNAAASGALVGGAFVTLTPMSDVEEAIIRLKGGVELGGSMDEADIAQPLIEARIEAGIKAASEAKGPEATGHCLNCGEELADGARWCDADCRDDWQKRESARARTAGFAVTPEAVALDPDPIDEVAE